MCTRVVLFQMGLLWNGTKLLYLIMAILPRILALETGTMRS